MKSSTKRILSILLSAFFLMATLVVYASLIQPEIQVASKLQALVASKSNLYESQKAAVAQVGKLVSQFQSAAKLQQTVGFAIPIGPNTTQALNQWQAITEASQVNLQSLAIQPGQTLNIKGPSQPLVKKLSNIPTDASVVGNYGAIKQFLNSIETNARVTNVVNFDFKLAAGNQPGLSNNPTYSMQLSVVTFYQEN